MTARTALLIALVVGFVLLLAALAQWARDARWESERRQLMVAKEPTLVGGGTGGGGLPPLGNLPRASPTPVPLPSQRVSVRYVTEKLPTPVASYLNQLITVEGERRQIWYLWQESLVPDSKTGSLDFLAEAEKWDKSLRVGEIDSTCLPFHVAYERFLAEEKAYLKRLVELKENGDLVQLALVQEEAEAQRPLRLARLQGRLREIQLAHPNLPDGLKNFRIEG